MRSELALRAVSGVVLGAVSVVLAWTGGLLFALFWLAAAIAVAAEWVAMARVLPVRRAMVVAGAGLAGLSACLVFGCPAGLALAVGLAAAGTLAALARTARDGAWAVAGFAYAALVAVVPVLARGDGPFGAALVLWIFAVVWTTDVVAYFTGRALGGPKLMPRVSPKKTWSGFLGGLAGGIAAGCATAAVAGRLGVPVPWSAGSLLAGAGLASVASQAGDLAESAMKRRFGVKDSGRLIPGHGGVMDRLDGFAAVLVLVALALLGARLAQA